MTIALLVMTDGRTDYLLRTVESARENLKGDISERWMFDDSGDPRHRSWLRGRFPDFLVFDAGFRRGFGGAIRAAWERLSVGSLAATIFHLEADFTFNRPIDLSAMERVLRERCYLAQLALRRQPWNAAERAAGGVIEQHPDAYEDRWDRRGEEWLEHRSFFTTNPSLYRHELLQVGWPEGERSEGRFGLGLLEHGFDGVPGEQIRFGYWGSRGSGEAVHHIGNERLGAGY